MVLTWIENGAVQMLSTVPQVSPGHTIERVRKRPLLTSTNGSKVRAVYGSYHTTKLHIPCVVDDYNHFMGSVDTTE